MRTFTVVGAYTAKGCKTKFRSDTTYTSKQPAQAASKAFTELCRVKRVRGVAAYYVVMREKTQGSAKKEYSYLLHRHKLETPVIRFAGTKKEFKIRYKNSIVSKAVPKRRAKCKPKSSGPMMRKSSMKAGGDEPWGANEMTMSEFPSHPDDETKCEKYCNDIDYERLVLEGQNTLLEEKHSNEQGVEPVSIPERPKECEKATAKDCTRETKKKIKEHLKSLVNVRNERQKLLYDLGEWI